MGRTATSEVTVLPMCGPPVAVRLDRTPWPLHSGPSQRSSRRHHDVARPVPPGSLRRPSTLEGHRSLAVRRRARHRGVGGLRTGARGLGRGPGTRLPAGRRGPQRGRVGPGRADRAARPDAARRRRHLPRLGRGASRVVRAAGRSRLPAQRDRRGRERHHDLARRSRRARPPAVSGDRGARGERPRGPEVVRQRGRARTRRSGSRWAAICSSPSRSRRWGPAS